MAWANFTSGLAKCILGIVAFSVKYLQKMKPESDRKGRVGPINNILSPHLVLKAKLFVANRYCHIDGGLSVLAK